VQLVTGADAVRAQADRLIAAAAVDICVAGPIAPGALEAADSSVRIRTIHPRWVLTRIDDRRRIIRLVAGGHHARTVERLPVDMLVVDRSVALLPVHGEGPDPTVTAAVLVWPGGLHDTLLATFERTWAVATALRVRADDLAEAAEDSMPTADDLRLLELLLNGLTDQAIAGRLGVGERTVQRRVRDLIDLVGVHTRIQLIWQASQRGWI
jgi:DNA-binding NarL/FixJ family response regulator